MSTLDFPQCPHANTGLPFRALIAGRTRTSRLTREWAFARGGIMNCLCAGAIPAPVAAHRLRSALGDLDVPRLGGLRLRHGDGRRAVVQGRADLVGLDVAGWRGLVLETAGAARAAAPHAPCSRTWRRERWRPSGGSPDRTVLRTRRPGAPQPRPANGRSLWFLPVTFHTASPLRAVRPGHGCLPVSPASSAKGPGRTMKT